MPARTVASFQTCDLCFIIELTRFSPLRCLLGLLIKLDDCYTRERLSLNYIIMKTIVCHFFVVLLDVIRRNNGELFIEISCLCW